MIRLQPPDPFNFCTIHTTGPDGRTDFNKLEMPQNSAQRAIPSKLALSFIAWGKRQNLFWHQLPLHQPIEKNMTKFSRKSMDSSKYVKM